MAGGLKSIAGTRPVEAPDMRTADVPNPFDGYTLPPDCPVTPLGIQGLKLWVLDAANQLIAMTTDCRKGDMVLLFGGEQWLKLHFPQYPAPTKENPNPEPNKFNQAEAQTALISACHAKGIFDPQGRVFGRGAHRIGDDGEQLVLHMGRSVLIAGETDKKGKPMMSLREVAAGALGDKLFPAQSPLPPPATDPSSPQEAEALMALFGEWRFQSEAAPLLLLGMSAQMHICGALNWRSHMWLAGPTSSGKSELQRLIRAVHGGWCLYTEDASEAAVRQTLKDDTLPVLIDEAEKHDNPEKQQAILNLMKKASSGAKLHRGSSDHRAQEFTAQSAFLFSSVLHGLAKGEEINRVVILNMQSVLARADLWVPPDLKFWRATGRKMHRRMIEQWPRFQRTFAEYKLAIASQGVEGRWLDTFGTLLACADCLLFDRPPSQESELNDGFGREKRWVSMIMPLVWEGRMSAKSDVERCLMHLLSIQLPGANGNPPEAVGTWLSRAMAPVDDLGGINETARARLKQMGLRLIKLRHEGGWKVDGEPQPDDWKTGWLAVAYPSFDPLKREFDKSKEWAGGAYLQSLGKLPDVAKPLKVRFGGPSPYNAIAIPLTAIREDEG